MSIGITTDHQGKLTVAKLTNTSDQSHENLPLFTLGTYVSHFHTSHFVVVVVCVSTSIQELYQDVVFSKI